jgi:hypothetical protein
METEMSQADRSYNIKNSFPDTLRKYYGIVSSACNASGISRDTYYRWRKESEEFATACDEASEHTGDFVESQLLGLIRDKDTAATIFYCKTKLRHRGYSEKMEHEHYGNRGKDSILQDVTHSLNDEDQGILNRYFEKRLNTASSNDHPIASSS